MYCRDNPTTRMTNTKPQSQVVYTKSGYDHILLGVLLVPEVDHVGGRIVIEAYLCFTRPKTYEKLVP